MLFPRFLYTFRLQVKRHKQRLKILTWTRCLINNLYHVTRSGNPTCPQFWSFENKLFWWKGIICPVSWGLDCGLLAHNCEFQLQPQSNIQMSNFVKWLESKLTVPKSFILKKKYSWNHIKCISAMKYWELLNSTCMRVYSKQTFLVFLPQMLIFQWYGLIN